MENSKIVEFISAKTLFSKTKLWIPVFFTALFSFMLIKDFLDISNDFMTLLSYSLFRVIYIIYIWAEYYTSKKYAELKIYVVDKTSTDSSLFDEKDELHYQQISKRFGVYILIFILASVLFEINRLLYDLIDVSDIVKIIIFIFLFAISFGAFMMSLIKSFKLLWFLKSVTVNKA